MRSLREPQQEASFNVLVVGGSVAGMTAAQSSERIESVLSADPRLAGRRVRVIIQACGGFKQPQHLNLVSYLFVQGCRVDCVLSIDGFNEVALGARNVELDADPIQPSLAHWRRASGGDFDPEGLEFEYLVDIALAKREARAWLERVERFGLHRSALIGTYVDRRILQARSRGIEAQLAYERGQPEKGRRSVVSGPEFNQRDEFGTEAVARSWYQSSRALQALCRSFDVLYVHVLQPTLHDEGSKPLTPREIRSGRALASWVEGVRRGYPRLREYGQKLRSEGIEFVDASLLFAEVEEGLYFDPCHFRKPGTDMLAEAAAMGILAALPAATGPSED
jgi:hypothetical protein